MQALEPMTPRILESSLATLLEKNLNLLLSYCNCSFLPVYLLWSWRARMWLQWRSVTLSESEIDFKHINELLPRKPS
jgi:hypothetical protein